MSGLIRSPSFAEYVDECSRIRRWRDDVEKRVWSDAMARSVDPRETLARLYAKHDAVVDEAWDAYEAGLPLPRPELPLGGPKSPVTVRRSRSVR